MATVLEERNDVDVSIEDTPKETSRDAESRKYSSDQTFEVILPIDESGTDQKSLDFAIQTARNFSAKLVILYITNPSAVPQGFLEFAHAERIRDYEWHYYNSLANEKLANIAKRAEIEGIEWVGHLHLGSVKNAIKHYSREKKRILILNRERRTGKVASLKSLSLGEFSKLGVSLFMA